MAIDGRPVPLVKVRSTIHRRAVSPMDRCQSRHSSLEEYCTAFMKQPTRPPTAPREEPTPAASTLTPDPQPPTPNQLTRNPQPPSKIQNPKSKIRNPPAWLFATGAMLLLTLLMTWPLAMQFTTAHPGGGRRLAASVEPVVDEAGAGRPAYQPVPYRPASITPTASTSISIPWCR